MAWITEIAEQEAKGEIAEVYAEVLRTPLGGRRLPNVPNIMTCMSLRPRALRGVWHLNASITFGASTLGRAREEMIATAVSALNRCHY